MRRLLDRFFSATSCNEIEHGIIENDDMSVALWKQALAQFDRVRSAIDRCPHGSILVEGPSWRWGWRTDTPTISSHAPEIMKASSTIMATAAT